MNADIIQYLTEVDDNFITETSTGIRSCREKMGHGLP